MEILPSILEEQASLKALAIYVSLAMEVFEWSKMAIQWNFFDY
jgi:hypothetical protein